MPDDLREPGSITRILQQANAGDREALNRLFPLLYAELHAIAGREMRREQLGHTLQPTALVNEAYLRLIGGGGKPSWKDRTHFLSAAARAMRHVLVDHARARAAQKRGRGLRVTLEEEVAAFTAEGRILDVLVLEDALTRLAKAEPRWAEVVELRFYGGMEIEEVAAALGVSPKTVKRDWQFAKAWLAEQLGPASAAPGGAP